MICLHIHWTLTFHVKYEMQEVELNVLNIGFAEIRETV